MPVICGVDFTPASLSAADVAARLAARWSTSLELVHVIDLPGEPYFGRIRDELTASGRMALQRVGDRLTSLGAQPELYLLEGKPDERIVDHASTKGAEAIVVSALGSRNATEWQLGGSADRIAQRSPVPTLVLRDAAPFIQWLEGKRRLRVVVGVDRTEISHAAVAFVRRLRAAGPADVTALHLYWASDEHRRLGMRGVRSLVDPDPEVERILKRELEAEVGEIPGTGSLECRVELILGRASNHLVGYAESVHADVLVVGSSRRNLLDRLWNGSTSRNALQRASSSVACVAAAKQPPVKALPRIRSVLAATDFSDAGNAAVRWAYAAVEQGGVVHLVNIVEPSERAAGTTPGDLLGPSAARDAAGQHEVERRLRALEPDAARTRDVMTEVHAVPSTRPAEAIEQTAERLGVDVIVVGTRGRSGVARAVLGSVAQEVGAKSGRPVLLVHPQA